MSCEKYAGWMTDAALDELRAERESEVLAHAMECDACRAALRHARTVRAFVDRGVESLVTGEPSLQFAAHLRRRIAHESEPAFPVGGVGSGDRERPRACRGSGNRGGAQTRSQCLQFERRFRRESIFSAIRNGNWICRDATPYRTDCEQAPFRAWRASA